MIGDANVGPADRRADIDDVGQKFGDVLGQRADPLGPFGKGGIMGEQMPVILDRRAAAGGCDQNGVERALRFGGFPGLDIAPGEVARFVLAAHMLDQRAAAALALRQHHFDALRAKQPDRGIVDLRAQHLLGASRQQRDAGPPAARLARETRPVPQ